MAEEPKRKDVMQEIFAKSLRNEKFRCLACFEDFLLFDTVTCSKCYQQTCHSCFECLDDRQYAHVPTKNKLCPGCRHVLVTVQVTSLTSNNDHEQQVAGGNVETTYDEEANDVSRWLETTYGSRLWSTNENNAIIRHAASNGHINVCSFLKDWGLTTRDSSAQQQ